ncbi:ABC transporter permease [Acidipila rosea]|uniref:NitT/TauT family transport system permease protein n=1 Tax=Acidipila rosea TaxID=768535 RepID=A0A4R1LBW3_9BACT|nr:ABC transporter permease subunit [Acidipila rosea]MBW4043699.1 ABC transporter permease subunit [Acidobacteriota bacterium]TCK73999.1 NitT/TauT family transport system permease protein [Acidipila rosea]
MSGLFKARYTLSRSQVLERTWPFVLDLGVAAGLLACFYAVLLIARYWMSGAVPEVVISLRPGILPVYAFYSVVRIGVAYLLSLLFAVGYGYVAAYNPRVEALMIATLDILQSIPVLSFLPALMLAMMALVPSRQLGIEMGAILLIFTGQVWNMAFSFYASLKSIPRELREACTINRFSAWQRLWQLELPFSAIGLIWNSMVSVAGGWFFLMICEMFPVGDKNFRLPGLGSYLQTAANEGNTRAMVYGLVTVGVIIVLTDQLIWRPMIAWSDKFKFENVESGDRVTSPILFALRRSNVLATLSRRTLIPLSEKIYHDLAYRREHQQKTPVKAADERRNTLLTAVVGLALVMMVIAAAFHALLLLKNIHAAEIVLLLKGAAATFLRVNVSLLIAMAWTVPVGVAIGFNPRLSKIAQPIAQIAASFPATALFPVVLLGLMKLGAGLGIGSIALMLLGTQWYVLFNVIAGALAVPSDLREVADVFHFNRWQRWKTVILPGIFPYLITGLVTASGGAWNASIAAEYFSLKGQTLMTLGLGAQISQATYQGRFSVLLLATIIMALMVVTINRLVWRRLYKLAETKYRLDA